MRGLINGPRGFGGTVGSLGPATQATRQDTLHRLLYIDISLQKYRIHRPPTFPRGSYPSLNLTFSFNTYKSIVYPTPFQSGVKITVNDGNVQGPDVLPNGKHIRQLQRQVSTKFRNIHLMVKTQVATDNRKITSGKPEKLIYWVIY